MKQLLVFAMLLITVSCISQNITIDMGAGILHGKNKLIHSDPVWIPNSIYKIYKDSLYDVPKTSASLLLTAGYIFRKQDKEFIELQAGLIAGADQIAPAFFYIRGSWYIINTEYFALAPYTGISFRDRSVHQGDYGFHATKGVQLIFWNYGEKTGKNAWVVNIDNTHRHISLHVGMKLLL